MIDGLQKLIRSVEKDQFLKQIIRYKRLANIEGKGLSLPIESFSIGTQDPQAPVLFITGGVHGLERVGAQLAWSLLKTTVDRLIWDKVLIDLFKGVRLNIIPLVNPIGYVTFSRSNAQGVDLMRNSPVRAKDKSPFLLAGHRLSAKLPWYQGSGSELEKENQALVDFFWAEAGESKCVVAFDFHSGFGLKDRIWFPFSYTQEPFPQLPHMHALTHLFEQTHPYHIYQIEPQSKGYLLHGDIWDYLFLEFQKKSSGVFLPMTLEMGSWSWVKKNPLQLLKRHGVFNPIKEHRLKRTYRRHHLLFDFLLRALHSNSVWSQLDEGQKQKHEQMALNRWY